jgi:DNA polymerase III alpha subunit
MRGHQQRWQAGQSQYVWHLAERFSNYAFNQAHSIAFAFSAYISAWFKTRFSAEFFCRLLNAGGGYYPLPFYAEEAKKCGVKMLPPDINHSDTGFIVEEGAIRTGLIFIKGIGEKMSARIVSGRGRGYANLETFLYRVRPSDQELSALMAVSAFASIQCPGFSGNRQKNHFQHLLGFIPSL